MAVIVVKRKDNRTIRVIILMIQICLQFIFPERPEIRYKMTKQITAECKYLKFYLDEFLKASTEIHIQSYVSVFVLILCTDWYRTQAY